MEDIPQKLNVSETPISPAPLSPEYPLGAGRGTQGVLGEGGRLDLLSKRMVTELQTIADTWRVLQPFLGVDKCVDCECLQAGLTELVMALEALPAEPEGDQLLTAVRQALDLSKLHGCLGCDPCEPADILVSFYQARDAASEDERCCCGLSCADGSSVAPSTPESEVATVQFQTEN